MSSFAGIVLSDRQQRMRAAALVTLAVALVGCDRQTQEALGILILTLIAISYALLVLLLVFSLSAVILAIVNLRHLWRGKPRAGMGAGGILQGAIIGYGVWIRDYVMPKPMSNSPIDSPLPASLVVVSICATLIGLITIVRAAQLAMQKQSRAFDLPPDE